MIGVFVENVLCWFRPWRAHLNVFIQPCSYLLVKYTFILFSFFFLQISSIFFFIESLFYLLIFLRTLPSIKAHIYYCESVLNGEMCCNDSTMRILRKSSHSHLNTTTKNWKQSKSQRKSCLWNFYKGVRRSYFWAVKSHESEIWGTFIWIFKAKMRLSYC